MISLDLVVAPEAAFASDRPQAPASARPRGTAGRPVWRPAVEAGSGRNGIYVPGAVLLNQ